MGEGTGVFRELAGVERAHVTDPLHRSRADIGRKLLVAINGQPFLQTELEPVAAGDAVAGPVVEIFVRDDALDVGEVDIGRGLRIGEHVLVVEDVEALVLHRAHVEIGHGDDVEDVEVVFEAEGCLIPAHRTLQCLHGVAAARFLAVLAVDVEGDRAARHRRERVGKNAEIAGDQGEEIRRLREGVVPDGIVAAAGQVAGLSRVAVSQENGRGGLRRLDAGSVNGKDIRTVEEIGDAPESFRLALGAIRAAGAIEAHQLGIRRRVDLGHDVQRKQVRGRGVNSEAVGRDVVVGGGQQRAVQADRDELQTVTDEDYFRRGVARTHREARRNDGRRRIKAEGERHGLDDEIGCAIILEANGRRFSLHGSHVFGGRGRRGRVSGPTVLGAFRVARQSTLSTFQRMLIPMGWRVI